MVTAKAMALRFGLNHIHSAGCNRLAINSDNFEVNEVMKNGGRSAGAAAAFFDDCYHIACGFPRTIFSTVIERQT